MLLLFLERFYLSRLLLDRVELVRVIDVSFLRTFKLNRSVTTVCVKSSKQQQIVTKRFEI